MEKVHVVVKIEKKDTDRRDEQEEEVTEYVVHPAASANAPSPKGRLESGTPLEAARPQQAKVSGRIAVEDNACTPDGVRHERRYAEVLPFASIFGVSETVTCLLFFIYCAAVVCMNFPDK